MAATLGLSFCKKVERNDKNYLFDQLLPPIVDVARYPVFYSL